MNQHNVPPMVVGDRYLVRYRSGTQRLDRTAVTVYLGEDADTLQFSSRPVAGTQRLPRVVDPGRGAGSGGHARTHRQGRAARGSPVRSASAGRMPQGERRWVVWDTERDGWADDARTTRRDAQDICDELNAATAPTLRDPEPE